VYNFIKNCRRFDCIIDIVLHIGNISPGANLRKTAHIAITIARLGGWVNAVMEKFHVLITSSTFNVLDNLT